MADIKITSFPAKNGESLLVELYGKEKINVLIDLGYSDTYERYVKKKLELIAKQGEQIDLLILTHYDKDHIEGVIEFLNDLKINKYISIDEIWVNDYLALSSDEIKLDKLNEEEKNIYNLSDFIMMEYRSNSSTRNKKNISNGDMVTVTKLIKMLGYDSKVNKSFKNRIVCIDNKEESVSINDEVKLKILSPTKDILKELRLKYIKWLNKKGNLYSCISQDELYELFIANLDDNIKEFADAVILKQKISNKQNSKELIDSVFNSTNIYVDNSLTNKSSIAFELEFRNNKILFTGDLDCKNIIDEIKGEKYTLIKVPHHGSKNNIDRNFLKSVQCKNYLISTDGSGKSRHPDLETIAFIAENEQSNIFINYELNEFSIDDDLIDELKKRYEFNLIDFKSDEDSCLELILKEGEVLWKSANF
ncbi:MBL fold metallo-hydrolase [Clostridium butyricum]|uniref:MBL fold metallo-hydrolase n=1 Tax=Clostridium butyricum TaxID=1492 RepID=UPI001369029F|nr:MBL fold metallo-hydrolase [Clostridium butyricum]MZI81198.1 MBL fold metallo-hydrolase [Clostridium butyricum]